MNDRLRLTEIFHSLQGESTSVGWPTVFVRLTGCPLRCVYCDTAYAFKGGNWHTFDQILATVKKHDTPYVTVTGGEPLAQKAAIPFLSLLCDNQLHVSLETSGAISVKDVDQRVRIVMDIKTPSSQEERKNFWENLHFLKKTDEIKFVISDQADYDYAKNKVVRKKLTDICSVSFSPCEGKLPLTTLADWILADKLNVRFNFQLHKILWGNTPGK